jgi:MFS family permease
VSDVRAGFVYGLFGTLTSLYAFPAGVLSDYIGIRWSLFIAAALNLVGRLVMALTVRRATAEAMLFSLLPLANGIDWGILATGVRRYTPARSRAVAFAVLASFLSMGQLLAGVVRDAFILPAAHDQARRCSEHAGAPQECSHANFVACAPAFPVRAGRASRGRANFGARVGLPRAAALRRRCVRAAAGAVRLRIIWRGARARGGSGAG